MLHVACHKVEICPRATSLYGSTQSQSSPFLCMQGNQISQFTLPYFLSVSFLSLRHWAEASGSDLESKHRNAFSGGRWQGSTYSSGRQKQRQSVCCLRSCLHLRARTKKGHPDKNTIGVLKYASLQNRLLSGLHRATHGQLIIS